MRFPSVLKTTAARLSALYMLLFALCAGSLLVYITARSDRMLIAQTQSTIDDEIEGLFLAYRLNGLPRFVRIIEWRAVQPGANLYLIASPEGQILSGNVERLEPGVLDIDGWTSKPFFYERYGDARAEQHLDNQPGEAASEHGRQHTAIAHVTRLPNRMIILVGRDLGERDRFRDVMRNSVMAALGVMGIGGLLIWLFVGRRALKHIDKVSEASRRIMGGDLGGRLPVTGAGDEFDRLSENLNAMLARIAELNEGLKQVSDNIAHDLKTPLTRLRNRAEAALGSKDDVGEYREALEATITESDQLIRTFNAILMISRLEAGYSAELLSDVDLSAVVADVVDLYEPMAEEAGVALVSEVPPEIMIVGNRELIAQSVSNVVNNAIKYSPGASDGPKVEVKLERFADTVVLSVSDNGPGIPDEEDRKRATERFVRLEASRSQPGSGLGLSLAKAVMKFHGGVLDLQPLEAGLCVVMRFPIKEPHK